MRKLAIGGGCRHVLTGIIFALFVYIIVNIFVNNHESPGELNNFWLVLVGCGLFGLFVLVLYFVVKRIKITKVKIVVISVLYLLAQVLFAILFSVQPQQDFGHVYELATASVMQSTSVFDTQSTGGEYYWGDYLYVCGNNIGLALLLRLIFSIANFVGITNFTLVGVVVNMIFIDIAILFLYKMLKLTFTKKTAFYFLIMSLTFAPFLLYVPIFYTDSMSLPFAIMALYYFFRYEYTKEGRKFDLALAAMLIGLGACIKITVLFLGIALIVYYMIREKKEPRVGFLFGKIVIIVCLMLIPTGLLNLYASNAMDPSKLEEQKVPYTHWVMMGLKGNGEYNQEDWSYTRSINGVEAKKTANIAEAEERFSEHLQNGLIPFYTGKLLHVWGNGAMFATSRLEKEGYSKSLYLVFLLFAQGEWIFILCGIILGCLFRKYLNRDQRDLQLVLLILCLGLIVFYLIWEARSRYLLNMSPLILLTGFLGVQATYNYMRVSGAKAKLMSKCTKYPISKRKGERHAKK